MEEELLIKLIEFIEQASPQIWAIAQRQVYVRIIRTVLWAILTTGSCPFLLWGAKSCWQAYKKDRYSMNDFGGVMLAAIALVSGIVAAALWTDLIGFVLNPQWYTISTLVNLVKR